MILLIGHVTPEEEKKYKLKDYQKISKVCGLNKDIIYTLYITNTNINEFGLIEKTEIILDELLLTLKIDKVYYKLNNASYLLSTCNFYGVTVYSLSE